MLKNLAVRTANSFQFINNIRTMARYVEKKILSHEQSEGAGARVRRAIGTPQVCVIVE